MVVPFLSREDPDRRGQLMQIIMSIRSSAKAKREGESVAAILLRAIFVSRATKNYSLTITKFGGENGVPPKSGSVGN